MKHIKNFFKNCLAIALSLLFCLFALELFCRLWQPEISYATWRHNSLSYSLNENRAWTLEPRSYFWGTVNSEYYRDELLAKKTSEDVFRILVIGGSAAFDLFKRDEETWPEQLKRKLAAISGRKIEIINAGTPGYSTWHSYRLLQEKLDHWNPDLILIYHMYNDWVIPSGASQEDVTNSYRVAAKANYISWVAHPNPTLETLSIIAPNAVDFVRGAFVGFLFRIHQDASIGYWCNKKIASKNGARAAFGNFKQTLSDILLLLQKHNLPSVVITQPLLLKPQANQEEKALYKSSFCGKSTEVVFADFLMAQKTLAEVANNFSLATHLDASSFVPANPKYFHDEVHLTLAGSTLLAESIANKLEPQLQH